MASSKPARQRPTPSPSGGGQGGVATIGLRERKKLKTKEAIQRAAMRLIEKQGYEETTVEEIAAAAEISPSTFFNYFPTKEDVVLLDVYDPLMIKLLRERPPDEPLNLVLRRVMAALGGMFRLDREIIMARARLILEVPELRARIWDELERTQALMTALLAERTGRKPDDYELRVTVRVMIAAMWEAFVEWSKDPRVDMVKLMQRALDHVESGTILAERPSTRRRKR